MRKTFFLTLLIIVFSSNLIYANPSIDAQSAILIDAESKRILFEKNAYERLPMASTTKIMTALVAIENGNVNDIVEIDRDVVGIEGSSIYLYEGELISLKDLLYGLMLRSGNDAAMAIGKYVGGDIDSFINMMNNKAKEIGANNTNFVNPHGLHDDRHYTTAYDLAIITSKAMEFDMFKEISGTKSWTSSRQKNHLFYNKNKTLWEYEGGDGVKTGYTTRSGRCLVTSATRDENQLIAVVLNDYNWFQDCYTLMDYGFNNFKSYVILDKGQLIGNVPVLYGDKKEVSATTEESFRYLLTEDELEKIKVDYNIEEYISAPVIKGDVLGEISVYLEGRLIYKGDLVADKSVEELSTFRKIIEKIRNRF